MFCTKNIEKHYQALKKLDISQLFESNKLPLMIIFLARVLLKDNSLHGPGNRCNPIKEYCMMKKIAAITGILALASFITTSAFAGVHNRATPVKTKPPVSKPATSTHHNSNVGHH